MAPRRLRIAMLNVRRQRWVSRHAIAGGVPPAARAPGSSHASHAPIDLPVDTLRVNPRRPLHANTHKHKRAQTHPTQCPAPGPLVPSFSQPQIYWASCWPVGTTFSVARTSQWASCTNTAQLTRVASRAALAATSDGRSYWVDTNGCLHLKIVDPGLPWEYES